jgi:5-methylcytosine-specific restriction endonuclease McrA
MNSKEYMRKYMMERYYRRKKEAYNLLGNKCAKCGLTRNLELDHIIKVKKKFDISKNITQNRFIEELRKCQLLCKECHLTKTLSERGHKRAKGEHGTISSYRYCKCLKCKAAKAISNKEYKLRKRRERSSVG